MAERVLAKHNMRVRFPSLAPGDRKSAGSSEVERVSDKDKVEGALPSRRTRYCGRVTQPGEYLTLNQEAWERSPPRLPRRCDDTTK